MAPALEVLLGAEAAAQILLVAGAKPAAVLTTLTGAEAILRQSTHPQPSLEVGRVLFAQRHAVTPIPSAVVGGGAGPVS